MQTYDLVCQIISDFQLVRQNFWIKPLYKADFLLINEYNKKVSGVTWTHNLRC